jgi:hypothetical protein
MDGNVFDEIFIIVLNEIEFYLGLLYRHQPRPLGPYAFRKGPNFEFCLDIKLVEPQVLTSHLLLQQGCVLVTKIRNVTPQLTLEKLRNLRWS